MRGEIKGFPQGGRHGVLFVSQRLDRVQLRRFIGGVIPEEHANRHTEPYGNHNGRKKVCSFCVDRVEHIDYKDLPRLRKYVSERAKIIPRRVTGTCAFHQRELTVAIKRARYMALMPYVSD